MKKSLALKSLLRSPMKTLLTFLLIAAASFALFSRVIDYAVTTRETENAKSLYHAVAFLDNEVPDIWIETKAVQSADGWAMTGYGEFILADNDRLDELEELLQNMEGRSVIYSQKVSHHVDAGGLANIERIRGLLESLFPIAVAAAVLIGLFGPLLVILQSAQEAAFLRILGVTKKRARCMLAIEQIVLCIAGIVLVAGGLALYDPGRVASGIETFAVCFGLFLLGCVCGAVAASIQVTRHRLLELLQVKE